MSIYECLFIAEAGILDLLKYPVTRKKSHPDAIEDIQDGLLYRKHFGKDGYFKGTSNEKKRNEIHVSFQINTDGVAIFRSSKYSIWPVGKGKESDPTDASANTSANASTDTPPTHYRRVGRHTTDASVDTLPTRRPTHYQHVGRHTTNTSADTLFIHRKTYLS